MLSLSQALNVHCCQEKLYDKIEQTNNHHYQWLQVKQYTDFSSEVDFVLCATD